MSLICTRRRLVLRAASAAGLCALPLPAPAQDQNQTLAQRILELANRKRLDFRLESSILLLSSRCLDSLVPTDLGF